MCKCFNGNKNNFIVIVIIINDCVTRFTETVNKLADPLFSKKIHTKYKHSQQVFKRADWFDDECNAAKRNFFIALSDIINIRMYRQG